VRHERRKRRRQERSVDGIKVATLTIGGSTRRRVYSRMAQISRRRRALEPGRAPRLAHRLDVGLRVDVRDGGPRLSSPFIWQSPLSPLRGLRPRNTRLAD
jgi:hypothetical protein